MATGFRLPKPVTAKRSGSDKKIVLVKATTDGSMVQTDETGGKYEKTSNFKLTSEAQRSLTEQVQNQAARPVQVGPWELKMLRG